MENSALQNERNSAALKALLRLPENKYCADCKRNDHPRWASCSLGIFICIRCSGIHRSMGVHVSRVKSVDLDTWTTEQVRTMQKWGNGRANKYWEATLSPGHIPLESKIENFVRTKYEAKKWVIKNMPIPDPELLNDEAFIQSLNDSQSNPNYTPASFIHAGPPSQKDMPIMADTNSSPRARSFTVSRNSEERKDFDHFLGIAARQDDTLAPSAPRTPINDGQNLAPISVEVPKPYASTGNINSVASKPPRTGDWKSSILSLYNKAPIPQSAQVSLPNLPIAESIASYSAKVVTSNNLLKIGVSKPSVSTSDVLQSPIFEDANEKFENQPKLISDIFAKPKLPESRSSPNPGTDKPWRRHVDHSSLNSTTSAISMQSYSSAQENQKDSSDEEYEFQSAFTSNVQVVSTKEEEDLSQRFTNFDFLKGTSERPKNVSNTLIGQQKVATNDLGLQDDLSSVWK